MFEQQNKTANLVARDTNCVWSKDHPEHQLKKKPSSNLNQKQRRKPIYSLPAMDGFAQKQVDGKQMGIQKLQIRDNKSTGTEEPIPEKRSRFQISLQQRKP